MTSEKNKSGLLRLRAPFQMLSQELPFLYMEKINHLPRNHVKIPYLIYKSKNKIKKVD